MSIWSYAVAQTAAGTVLAAGHPGQGHQPRAGRCAYFETLTVCAYISVVDFQKARCNRAPHLPLAPVSMFEVQDERLTQTL